MSESPHKDAIRYLVCKIRRFKRYLRSNNIYNVISITHEPDLNTIHVYSISPLIVNLCSKNLMALLDIHWSPGSYTFVGASRVRIDNTYGSKTRVLSNWLYSIKVNLVFEFPLVSLIQYACKRLPTTMYNPDLLPFELINLVASEDPIVSIRYLLDPSYDVKL